MLAHRIIPTLLIRGTSLVKGKQFNAWRSVGHALQAVRTHQLRGVDELIVLDIGATPAKRPPNFELVDELTESCFSPITVGGGVWSVHDVERLLKSGADKISICTAAIDKYLIEKCANKFGSQAIVVSIDVKNKGVFVNCGLDSMRKLVGVSMENPLSVNDEMLSPIEYAKEMQLMGAGEILLTSIDREGTMEGYDLDLIHAVSKAVSIPVIAHGGCSGYEDMYQAIEAGASAVAAGAMFLFTENTPKGAAEYLHAKGIEVRIPDDPSRQGARP